MNKIKLLWTNEKFNVPKVNELLPFFKKIVSAKYAEYIWRIMERKQLFVTFMLRNLYRSVGYA
jgi:hypothetical protein